MIKLVLPILFLATSALGAEVPKSPYIGIVYRYGDAIVKKGDDNHTLDQNDLRLLYTLSELSNKPKYAAVADEELKWLLQNPARITEGSRPWMLWDRCFAIDLDRSRALVEKVPTIRALAAAYPHAGDDRFLKLLESELVPANSPVAQIALAIDAWGAATRLPQPLADKLRRFAESQDSVFLATNQNVRDARLAMLAVSRYENTGNTKYLDRLLATADAFRTEAISEQASPMTFGHVISLQLAAWRSTARQEYLDCARKHADIAVKTFWFGDNPVPTVTKGADTLVLSLLELHLSILHITAIRCPPNTIDR